MRFTRIGASVFAAAAALLSAPSFAADNQAGTPLDPAEAAGAWTVEAGGRSLCTLTLGPDKSVKAASSCGSVLPGTPVNWAPTANGMNLLAADGRTLMGFGRWSNSLLVAHRSSGGDIQLRRSGPDAPRATSNGATAPAAPAATPGRR
jgi:hypothetical protein